jgi:hypothetical protein
MRTRSLTQLETSLMFFGITVILFCLAAWHRLYDTPFDRTSQLCYCSASASASASASMPVLNHKLQRNRATPKPLRMEAPIEFAYKLQGRTSPRAVLPSLCS